MRRSVKRSGSGACPDTGTNANKDRTASAGLIREGGGRSFRRAVPSAFIFAVIAVIAVGITLTGCAERPDGPAVTTAPGATGTADAAASADTGTDPAGYASGGTAEETPGPASGPATDPIATGLMTADPTTAGPTASAPAADPSPSAPAGTEVPSAPPAPTDIPTDVPTAVPTAAVTPVPATEKPTDVPGTALPEGKYSTDNGVLFTSSASPVSGNDTFTVYASRELTLTFESGSFDENFNRMCFTYTSGKPLRLTVAYTDAGKAKTDSYFLEAGENILFRGLISSYLSGGRATQLSSISVKVISSGSTRFRLASAETQMTEVYSDVTRMLENGRFKVGVKLAWGGGINYFEDKTLGISGVTNLVNQHDTGRLIQQSYYGTGGNSEYTPGSFNGSNWAYNPVQGGDMYGNASRLIDVEVGEDYIYVKAQPQDWSLNGQLTPSYMENRYTVADEYLRVDNRFVDFSGWEHRYANQELPAFYTISYLDKFVWYGGREPWTDGALSQRADLNFWGDPAYAASCRFAMNVANTETWCAWVSSKDGKGIGLYVPEIDLFYAGRFAYNGSKSAQDNATNYVAPLDTIKMVSFVPIEYSYLITAGRTEDIRATFKKYRDFADNSSLRLNAVSERTDAEEPDQDYTALDFTKKKNAEILAAANNATVSYSSSQKALALKVTTPSDPQTMLDFGNSPVTLNASDYTKLEIEYMLPVSNGLTSYVCDLFLCTGQRTSPDGNARVRGELIRDGQYHTLTLELSGLDFWSGKINRIRFDFLDACEAGDTMYLKSFRLK